MPWKSGVAGEASEAIADRVVAKIYDECQKIADNPGIGHYRLDLLTDDYRFWRVWSYVIAYRWRTSPTEVVAIVHGARDLAAFLRRRE